MLMKLKIQRKKTLIRLALDLPVTKIRITVIIYMHNKFIKYAVVSKKITITRSRGECYGTFVVFRKITDDIDTHPSRTLHFY
jgi:hypothetical protein